MDRAELPLAVFGMSARRFALRRGSLTQKPTQRALEDVDLRRQVVPRFIQVLPTATDNELVGPLSAILTEALLRSEKHIDLDSLAQSLFPGGLWSTVSPIPGLDSEQDRTSCTTHGEGVQERSHGRREADGKQPAGGLWHGSGAYRSISARSFRQPRVES